MVSRYAGRGNRGAFIRARVMRARDRRGGAAAGAGGHELGRSGCCRICF